MEFREALRVGWDGLRSHLLRTFLTALGIVFGVAAVISMLSIGEGARQEALEQIQLMGISNILIYDVPPENTDDGEGRSNQSLGLRQADAVAMAAVHPGVERAVPERWFSRDASYGRETVEATVVGTTPDYAPALNYTASSGRFFSFQDVTEVRRVCALGAGVKRSLFHYANPVGERIKIGPDWYTVIGVMEHRAYLGGEGSNEVRDTNHDIYIPITSSLQRFTHDQFDSELSRITVQVQDPDRLEAVANGLAATMQRRHHGVEDYQIVVPEALLRQRQATQRIFNIVMGAIAGISLLVGGIGIMNIMLASILERTQEIGIRLAIGARQSDILRQFLLEAVIVSLLGGALGIALGFALTGAIATYADWRTVVSWTSVVVSFGVAASVGVIFGYYPARRAARMNPIDCLRYE